MNVFELFEQARRLLSHQAVLSPDEAREVKTIPEYAWRVLSCYPTPDEWGSEYYPPVLPKVVFIPQGKAYTECVSPLEEISLRALLCSRGLVLLYVSRSGHVQLYCSHDHFECELAVEPEELGSLSDYQLCALARLIRAGLVTEYRGAGQDEILAAAEEAVAAEKARGSA